LRLLPLGIGAKQGLIQTMEAIGLADTKLSFNVGNMLSFGFRPQQ
jgi:hypothetical protein